MQAKLHQALPFEQLMMLLDVEPDMSRHPIFQVMFGVQDFGNHNKVYEGLPFSKASVRGVATLFNPAKFDLDLFVCDGHQQLSGHVNYAVSLFSPKTINRMITMYITVLKHMVSDPHQRITDMSLLEARERDTLLYHWSKIDSPTVQHKTLHQVFQSQVEKTPNNIALVFENQQLSYRQLNEKANQLAHVICRQYQQHTNAALLPDTLIALYLDRSLEMVIAILAILKAGAAYVPISPQYPGPRTQFIVSDCKTQLILTQQHYQPMLAQMMTKTDENPHVLAIDNVDHQDAPSENLAPTSCAKHLAYVFYTSGTTGNPKGVMIDHKASVCRNHYWADISGARKNSYLFKTNYVFDVSVSDLFSHLLGGAKIIITRSSFDVTEIKALVNSGQVNACHFVPSQFSALADTDISLDHLARLYFSGENLQKEHLSAIDFGQTDVFNCYGPTETGEATCHRVTSAEDQNIIGRPFAGVQVYVLQNGGALAPIGTPGELTIGGAGLSRGYLNRPELTSVNFVANRYFDSTDPDSSRVLYKTGDLVRFTEDGNLIFMGRLDNQLKIRGMRIEPQEIEQVIAAGQNVSEVLVTAKEITSQSSDKRLIAYVVLTCSDRLQTQRVIEQLKLNVTDKLPSYMMPSAWVVLDQFPLTTNGKINHRALPEADFSHCSNEYKPAVSDTEKQLCEIWQNLLAIEQVGIADNFLMLGGHSLQMSKMINQIDVAFAVRLNYLAVFEHCTVAQIGQMIDKLVDSPDRVATQRVLPLFNEALYELDEIEFEL